MLICDNATGEGISELIQEMRDGSEDAATLLWHHYWDRLLEVSKRNLSRLGSEIADEEDVAITAFNSFVTRMRRGDFSQVENRGEAWKLLVVITIRKAINLVRDATRQRRCPQAGVSQTSTPSCLEAYVDKDVSPPDVLAMISESVEQLLNALDSDELREIAMSKVAGFTNKEIATSLGRSVATIERRLNLIRAIWEEEL